MLTRFALLAVLSLTFVPADNPGYDDTPMIPGQKWRVHDKNRPHPGIVTPGNGAVANTPPSDAIVLFDGSKESLAKWTSDNGGDAKWDLVEGGAMQVNGTGTIRTKDGFGDCQLHLEFATPAKVEGESQGRGNSGVFLMGFYELQILDSYENVTYADGQAAAVYGQTPPLVNSSRKPGEWQVYDIAFTAPRFAADGKLESPARITVFHNGVLVQNGTALTGPVAHRAVVEYKAHPKELPLGLQDHGNPMRFRNIWIRKLN